MNITFRQGSETFPERLLAQSEQHLQKVAKRLDKNTTEAFAYIDVEKESSSVHSEHLWRTTITITFGGEQWSAAKEGSTIELATTRALKDMQEQVYATRSRKIQLYRKGGALLKRLSRRTPQE